jgi:hypothetical protein
MALNWDVTGVENWEELFSKNEEDEMTKIYERVLMFTLTIGVRNITDKNWKKFFDRVYMWERIKGANYYSDTENNRKEVYIKEEDVKRMIGLKTNASEFSKTEYLKKLSWGMDI